MDYNERVRQTDAAFDDPQVGDRFSEMLTHWVYIVGREGDQVAVLARSAPCTFPEDGELWRGSVGEFKKRYGNRYIPGYTILLEDRGNCVEGWLESKASPALT